MSSLSESAAISQSRFLGFNAHPTPRDSALISASSSFPDASGVSDSAGILAGNSWTEPGPDAVPVVESVVILNA